MILAADLLVIRDAARLRAALEQIGDQALVQEITGQIVVVMAQQVVDQVALTAADDPEEYMAYVERKVAADLGAEAFRLARIWQVGTDGA